MIGLLGDLSSKGHIGEPLDIHAGLLGDRTH